MTQYSGELTFYMSSSDGCKRIERILKGADDEYTLAGNSLFDLECIVHHLENGYQFTASYHSLYSAFNIINANSSDEFHEDAKWKIPVNLIDLSKIFKVRGIKFWEGSFDAGGEESVFILNGEVLGKISCVYPDLMECAI